MLTQDRLKELLVFEEATGEFVWKVDQENGIKRGDLAGAYRDDGFIMIQIDSLKYKAHELACFYENGVIH